MARTPPLAKRAIRRQSPAPAIVGQAPQVLAPRPLDTEKQQALVARLQEEIRAVSGLKTRDVSMMLAEVLANLQVWHRPDNLTSALSMAIATFAELRPRTVIEAMLTIQMVASFQSGTHLIASGFAAGQSLEASEWKARTAINLMRLFTEQLEALESLRGERGRQRVEVKHVHVGAGGQAVVGVVSAPRQRRRALPGGGE